MTDPSDYSEPELEMVRILQRGRIPYTTSRSKTDIPTVFREWDGEEKDGKWSVDFIVYGYLSYIKKWDDIVLEVNGVDVHGKKRVARKDAEKKADLLSKGYGFISFFVEGGKRKKMKWYTNIDGELGDLIDEDGIVKAINDERARKAVSISKTAIDDFKAGKDAAKPLDDMIELITRVGVCGEEISSFPDNIIYNIHLCRGNRNI